MTIKDLDAGLLSEPSQHEVSPTLVEMRQRLAELAYELEEETTQSDGPEVAEAVSYEQLLLDDALADEALPAAAGFDNDDATSLATLPPEELLHVASLLQSERDSLRAKLSQLPDLSRLEETKQQFEQAVAEIQWLRQRNSELEAGHRPEAETDDGELDWESQKEQWLSRLQGQSVAAPAAKTNNAAKQDKAIVDGLNRRIRELEREAESLRSRLARTVEVDKVLDADQVVQAERARLKELQQQWQEKTRSCELELSKERVNLTRLRMELEERAQTLDTLKERLEGRAGEGPKSNWLSYLVAGKSDKS